MDKELLLPFIIASIPAAIILFFPIIKFFGFIRNLFSDKVQYEATVLKKDEREECRGTRSGGQYSIPYRVKFYFITFKTPKHKKLRLKVDTPDFKAVKEGDTGILTLQGKKFISFEKKMTVYVDG